MITTYVLKLHCPYCDKHETRRLRNYQGLTLKGEHDCAWMGGWRFWWEEPELYRPSNVSTKPAST